MSEENTEVVEATDAADENEVGTNVQSGCKDSCLDSITEKTMEKLKEHFLVHHPIVLDLLQRMPVDEMICTQSCNQYYMLYQLVMYLANENGIFKNALKNSTPTNPDDPLQQTYKEILLPFFKATEAIDLMQKQKEIEELACNVSSCVKKNPPAEEEEESPTCNDVDCTKKPKAQPAEESVPAE